MQNFCKKPRTIMETTREGGQYDSASSQTNEQLCFEIIHCYNKKNNFGLYLLEKMKE